MFEIILYCLFLAILLIVVTILTTWKLSLSILCIFGAVYYDFDFETNALQHIVNKVKAVTKKLRHYFSAQSHSEHIYYYNKLNANMSRHSFEKSVNGTPKRVLTPATPNGIEIRHIPTPLSAAYAAVKRNCLAKLKPDQTPAERYLQPKQHSPGFFQNLKNDVSFLSQRGRKYNLGTPTSGSFPNPENHTYTHQALYHSPGLFPIVNLKKRELPVIDIKPKKCTVRIAPPDASILSSIEKDRPNSSPESTSIRTISEPVELSTRSVLDALKEISRKRIRVRDEYSPQDEAFKRLKVGAQDPALGEPSGKRNRDDSPPHSPINTIKKFKIPNEIESSLSSSRIGVKRKASNVTQSKNQTKQRKVLLSIGTQTLDDDDCITELEEDYPKVTEARTRTVAVSTDNDHCKSLQHKLSEDAVDVGANSKIIIDDDDEHTRLPLCKPKKTLVVFSSKPLEILHKNKLSVMVGALTGEKSTLIPLPKLSLSESIALKKAEMESKQSEEKAPTVSVPSPATSSITLPSSVPTLTSFSNTPSNSETKTSTAVTSTGFQLPAGTVLPTSGLMFKGPDDRTTSPPAFKFNENAGLSTLTSKSESLSTITTTSAASPSSFKPTNPITFGIPSTSVPTSNTTTTATFSIPTFGTPITSVNTNQLPAFPSSTTAASTTPATSENRALASSSAAISVSPTTKSSMPAQIPTFGSSLATTTSTSLPSSAPAFTFGNPTTNTPVTRETTLDSSKTTTTTSSAPTPVFSFGNTTPAVSTSTLMFEAPATLTSTSAFGISAAATSLPGFGASNTSALTFGTPTSSTVMQKPAFGSQGGAVTTAAPAFGAPATPNTSAPTFGAVATPNTSAPTFDAATTTASSAPIFAFGAPATSASSFGGASSIPPTTSSSLFAKPATPAATSTLFGSSPAATTNATTPIFGVTTVTSSSGFGAIPSATTAGSSFGSANSTALGHTFTAPTSSAPAPTFGMPTTTAPAFGSPAPKPVFGIGNNTSSPASTFGTPSTTTSIFGGTNASATPAFGAPNTVAPMFGAPTTTASIPSFGNTFTSPTTKPSFGVASNSTPATASGFSASVPSFGASNAFGAATTTAPSFGSSTGFGTALAKSPVFAFGATTTASTTNSTPAATFNFTAGSNSQNNNNAVKPFAFGSNQTTTAFGSNPTTGTSGFGGQSTFGATNNFGNSTNSAVPAAFGGASAGFATGSTAFGQQQQQPQQQSSQPPGVFTFGASAPSNNNNAGGSSAAPFQFGAGSEQTPKPGGFNFTASSGGTPTPNFNFTGGNNVQFGAAATPNTGMFSIGSGSTTPKPRHIARARRRN